MPRRRDEEPRVLGPTWLPSRQQWRVLVKRPGKTKDEDRQHSEYFDGTKEEIPKAAQEYADGIAAKLARFNNTTLGQAIDAYLQHLTEKGTGEDSRTETIRRLKLFFPDHVLTVGRVTPERAEAYYNAFRKRTKKNGEQISDDYQLNTLAETKSFMRWCVKKAWISASPIEDVEGIGQRSAGKESLTGDEAYRFLFAAAWMAWGGDLGALGAGLILTNAFRQKDVRVRLVRDVDLNGTVLRVGMTNDRKRKGKTKKSNRPRKIHEVFQPLIRQLVAGRQPLEPLFMAADGGFHTKSWQRAAVKRVCKAAGVPNVCPHSLKGTSGTVLAEGGEQVDDVVKHLSHEHRKISERHYLADGAVAAAQAERTFAVIMGGKR